MAPEFTIGLVRASWLYSIAVTELNAMPVALTPSRPRASSAPSSSQISAKTKGLETLMIGEGTLGIAGRVDAAAGANDADPEQIGRHRRQCRVDFRHLPLRHRLEPVVRLRHQLADPLRRRQPPGGHEGRSRCRIQLELPTHAPPCRPQNGQISGTTNVATTKNQIISGRPSFQ